MSVVGAGGSQSVTSKIEVTPGGSTDVIAHRQVDPSAPPVITTYENDLHPVGVGKGRLVVAHTAAVGPADVRVDGKVLFANIASGEDPTLEVPAKTYPVSIVPAATAGPTVLGPVQLPVAGKSLTRVFAIGVVARDSMDAIVQVLPLATRGTGTTPGRVESATVERRSNSWVTVPVTRNGKVCWRVQDCWLWDWPSWWCGAVEFDSEMRQ